MPAHIAPESWPPWPGSMTTTDALSGTVAASLGRGVDGVAVHSHHAAEAIITIKPSQAIPLRIARPSRDPRSNIGYALVANQLARLFVGQSAITNGRGPVALQDGRFNRGFGEL